MRGRLSLSSSGLPEAMMAMLVGAYVVDRAGDRLTGPGRRLDSGAVVYDVEVGGTTDAVVDERGVAIYTLPQLTFTVDETITVHYVNDD